MGVGIKINEAGFVFIGYFKVGQPYPVNKYIRIDEHGIHIKGSTPDERAAILA